MAFGAILDTLFLASTADSLSSSRKKRRSSPISGSTAIISNDVDLWGDYLADGPLVMAFFDRLVEDALTIRIKGLFYRAHRKRNGPKDGVDDPAAPGS